MILFVDKNTGVLFLSFKEIPPVFIPGHGIGAMTPERTRVRTEDLVLAQMEREDEEIVILASQIIMRYGTFGLS